MTKIKEAVDNHKNYEKFHMETIVAHNGVLVDIVVSASYEETKFDKIMADCKRQEKERMFAFEQSIALTVLKCKCYILYNLICFICFLFQLLYSDADY